MEKLPRSAGGRDAGPERGRAAVWFAALLLLVLAPTIWFVLRERSGSGTAGPLENAGSGLSAPTEGAGSGSGDPGVARGESGPAIARSEGASGRDPQLPSVLDEEFPTGVSGRLLSISGVPVGGALIELFLSGEVRRVAAGRSDAEGGFRVTGVPPDEYLTLVASHPGFGPSVLDEIETAPGVLVPVGRITLHAAARLEGIAIDEASGKRIAGVEIRALPMSEGTAIPWPGALSASREDGSFVLVGLFPGVVRLLARAPGYAATTSEAIGLEPGATRKDFRLRLRAVDPLEGEILDEADRPVANAVVVYQPRPALVGELEQQTVVSDARGRFAIPSPDPARGFSVRTVDTRYLPALQQEVAWNPAPIRLRVVAGSRLKVRLQPRPNDAPTFVLERGAPTAGDEAPVAFQTVEDPAAAFVASGEAWISGPLDPQAWYRVRASAGDTSVATSEPLRFDAEQGIREIALTLERRALLRGIVRGDGGAPLEGALVRLQLGELVATARTAPDGRFASAAFGGGIVEVAVEKAGYTPFDDLVQVGAEGVELEVRLEHGGRIHGKVTLGGRVPPSPLRLWLRSSGLDFHRQTTTAADGSYAFDGLPLDDSYELYPLFGTRSVALAVQSFRHPIDDDDRFSFDEDYEFGVDVDSEQPEVRFDFDVPYVEPGRITGTVRDARGPRSGLTVLAELFDTGFEGYALTDAEGRFSIEVQGAGDVDLNVRSSGGERRLWSSDEIVLEPGGVRDVEVLLRTGRVETRVLDANGAPVANAKVTAHLRQRTAGNQEAPVGEQQIGTTGSEGVHAFEDLPEGLYDFEALAAGYAIASVRDREVFDSAETMTIEIALVPAADVQLQLRDLAGEPLGAVNLKIYDDTGAPVSFADGSRRRTVTNGELHLDHLPPGGYRFLLLRGPSRFERYANLRAGSNETLDWRFDLQPYGSREGAGAGKDSREKKH